MSRYINQSGFGTIMAIVLVASLAALIVAVGPVIDRTALANRNMKNEIDAKYAADAGMKYALSVINKDVKAVETLSGKNGKLENDAKWKLETIKENNGFYTIRSIGEAGSIKKSSKELSVRIKIDQGDEGPFNKYALYSGNQLTFHGASQVYENKYQKKLGQIGVLGDISFSIDEDSKGFAGIDGIKDNTISGYLKGEKLNNRDALQWYTVKDKKEIGEIYINEDYFKNKIEDWNYNSDLIDSKIKDWNYDPQNSKILNKLSEINANLSNPILHIKAGGSLSETIHFQSDKQVIIVDSNVSFTDTAKIVAKEVVLFIDGSFEMNGFSQINADSITIYAKNGIKFTDQAKLKTKSIQLYTKGNVDLSTNATIYADGDDPNEGIFKLNANTARFTDNIMIDAKKMIEIQMTGDKSKEGGLTLDGNGSPRFNTQLSDGIVRAYGRGCLNITDTVQIGSPAMFAFGNKIAIENAIHAQQAIFIAGEQFVMGGSGQIAAAYAINSLIMKGGSSCEVNALGKKGEIIKLLGDVLPETSGNSSEYTIEDGSWKFTNEDKNTDTK